MLTVRFGPDGRVLIPAELRRAMRVVPGEPMIARVESGRLLIERREQVLSRLQDRFAAVPRDVSLVDELLVDRRREAGGE